MSLLKKTYVNVTAGIDILVISHDIKRVASEAEAASGLLTVFSPAGTTGITLFENDPKIFEDYRKWVEEQIPVVEGPRPSRRSGTGKNFAHLRAKLVGYSVTIPIDEGKLQMGAWQEVVLFDFDDKVGRKEFFISVIGG
jgi:secondary thiamine-phosphate synthase enzyme